MNETKNPETIESLKESANQMRISLDFAKVGICHTSFVTHEINRRKEFENLLNLLLKTMPSLVSYIDKDLVYRYVNQTYERWFGILAKDIIGKNVVDII